MIYNGVKSVYLEIKKFNKYTLFDNDLKKKKLFSDDWGWKILSKLSITRRNMTWAGGKNYLVMTGDGRYCRS